MRKLLPIALLVLAAGGGAAWWWTSRAPAPLEYVVVRGDTLSKIAARYDVSVDALRTWNGIQGDLIEVDQVLLIHLEGAGPEAAPSSPPPTRPRARPIRGAPPKEAAEEGPLAGLSVPAPEPCVPFDPELGDEGMAAPAGLGYGAIKEALDGIIQHALACPHETAGAWSPVFELQVGCDGVVAEVRVADAGGAPSEWTRCAAEVLKRADFPAHDMASGMPVTYPVSVEY